MSKRLTSEPRVRLANTHLDCKAWFVVTDSHQPNPDDFPKLCSPGNFVYDRTGQNEGAFGHPRNGGLICLLEGYRGLSRRRPMFTAPTGCQEGFSTAVLIPVVEALEDKGVNVCEALAGVRLAPAQIAASENIAEIGRAAWRERVCQYV